MGWKTKPPNREMGSGSERSRGIPACGHLMVAVWLAAQHINY